ncbi:MAG: hypothetical protein ACXAEN_15145 [Candidatus Thorarchaeota archaeon]
MPKVLFLDNTAGAITPLAEWLVKKGHVGRIIIRKNLDPYGLTTDSPTAIVVDSSPEFFKTIRQEIRRVRPTHIHVNSTTTGLTVARTTAPYTPVVFHYNGSEVRGRPFVHPEVKLDSFDDLLVVHNIAVHHNGWKKASANLLHGQEQRIPLVVSR